MFIIRNCYDCCFFFNVIKIKLCFIQGIIPAYSPLITDCSFCPCTHSLIGINTYNIVNIILPRKTFTKSSCKIIISSCKLAFACNLYCFYRLSLIRSVQVNGNRQCCPCHIDTDTALILKQVAEPGVIKLFIISVFISEIRSSSIRLIGFSQSIMNYFIIKFLRCILVF